MSKERTIPLSLYIHIPWCVKKCPYCDFNSYALRQTPIPEDTYIQALIQDFQAHTPQLEGRPIHAIFIGGGTPSLFHPQSIKKLLDTIHTIHPIAKNAEITMEANPGTCEYLSFADLREAGINRLSLGIQSFHPDHLKRLGRIHNPEESALAIQKAQEDGFDNINLDLMYALPNQTVEEATKDLKTALSFQTTHLSWYQLTLEPQTHFYKCPPPLPSDSTMAQIEQAGYALLNQHQFTRYEISAYSPTQPCQHNINYWQFGDYLGIGAGAHSKITHTPINTIARYYRDKKPAHYLKPDIPTQHTDSILTNNDRVMEFFMNAWRLTQPIPPTLFEERTQLSWSYALPLIEKANAEKLITQTPQGWIKTPKGTNYLNELVMLGLEH